MRAGLADMGGRESVLLGGVPGAAEDVFLGRSLLALLDMVVVVVIVVEDGMEAGGVAACCACCVGCWITGVAAASFLLRRKRGKWSILTVW